MKNAFVTRESDAALIETLRIVAGNGFGALNDDELARLGDALTGRNDLPALARLGIALVEYLVSELNVVVAQRGSTAAAREGALH